MLFALTLWVMQITAVFSSQELPILNEDLAMHAIDMAYQSQAEQFASIDAKECQSENHNTCDNGHCVSCMMFMPPKSSELTIILSVTHHDSQLFISPRQYPLSLYRPPQIN